MYKSFMYKPFADHPILPLCRCIIPSVFITSLTLFTSQANAAESSMEYYHYNHQGSLLEVYDSANKRLLSQAWSPWGERQVLHTNTGNNNTAALLAAGLPVHIGYTGHKELLSTGLTFAGDTRLYDARLKRFLNSDDRTTGGIRGQNRYSYSYNNPMTYIDPDGHVPRLTMAKEWAKRFRLDTPIQKNSIGAILANSQEVLAILNDPRLKAMATLIQSNYRGYRVRKIQLPLFRQEKYHDAIASFRTFCADQRKTNYLGFGGRKLADRIAGVVEERRKEFDHYFDIYYDYVNCKGNPILANNIAAILEGKINQHWKKFKSETNAYNIFETEQKKLRDTQNVSDFQIKQYGKERQLRVRKIFRSVLDLGRDMAVHRYFDNHAVDYQGPDFSEIVKDLENFNIRTFID